MTTNAPTKKPTLQDYIEKHGAQKIAAAIGSSVNPIYEWYKKTRQPSYYYACKLIELSKGKLDFDSIYRPFYLANKTKK